LCSFAAQGILRLTAQYLTVLYLFIYFSINPKQTGGGGDIPPSLSKYEEEIDV